MFKKDRKRNSEIRKKFFGKKEGLSQGTIDYLKGIIEEEDDELPNIYVSGEAALGLPCDLDTCGKFNVSISTYRDDEKFKACLKNSKRSPFKDYGIQEDYFIEYRPLVLYRVANHVRVYLDMLYEGRFEELNGYFDAYLNSSKARRAIFEMVYLRCKHLACFTEINDFLIEEFGNAWVSFVNGLHSNAKYLTRALETCDKELKRTEESSLLNVVGQSDKFTLASDLIKQDGYANEAYKSFMAKQMSQEVSYGE